MQEDAYTLLELGYSVIPIEDIKRKSPPEGLAWGRWQKQPMTPPECEAYFRNAAGVAIVCGQVSGNLLLLDFDNGGELFDPWKERVNAEDHELLQRVVVESSQSGGKHVWFRCDSDVDGNQKLAQRHEGSKTICLIETRGEGGYCAVAPTPGYEILRGDFSCVEHLDDTSVEILLSAARELDEVEHVERSTTKQNIESGSGVRPGDAFNQSGDVHELLARHDWKLDRVVGDTEQWCRPGKSSGCSATFRDRVFYPFSSNCGLEPNRGYSPFQLYTALEHRGDYGSAAKALRAQDYGESQDGPITKASNLMDLIDADVKMRPEVIPGYLRQGETMNIVAAPKTGKSWLIMQLILAACKGGTWLGINIPRLNVLLIDNELHQETLANRMKSVIEAIDPSFRSPINFLSLRGKNVDLEGLETILSDESWDLIILDAWYRFIPQGVSENDNAQVMSLYNRLDTIADKTGAAIIAVHHTSKGDQRGKGITDIGSGAGSQTRACDTHMVLLPTEDEDVIQLSATCRSFKAPEDMFMTFDGCWQLTENNIAPATNYTAEQLANHVRVCGGVVGKAEMEYYWVETIGIPSGTYTRLYKLCVERMLLINKNNLYYTPEAWAAVNKEEST